MLMFGIDLAEGSKIANLSIDAGTSDPSNPDAGELFYRTDTQKLRTYNGTSWENVGPGLEPDTTENLTVGYTTDVEVLGSDTITPDMTTESIKTRSVAGNVTLNFPTNGNGVCHIILTIDGTNRTVTLGANLESVGGIPTLTASTTWIATIIRDTATHAIIQFQQQD